MTKQKQLKILFLDIDGVANCAKTTQRHRGFIGIDPYMAFLIGKIQLDTDCQFVLSSSWRFFNDDGIKEIEKQIAKMFDVTPDSTTGFRGDEIIAWLKNHPEVTKYAILDDNSDFYPDQPLFKTEWETGITPEIAAKVIKYLNEDKK